MSRSEPQREGEGESLCVRAVGLSVALLGMRRAGVCVAGGVVSATLHAREVSTKAAIA